MVSDYIKKIAFELGLTDDYIQKKVDQVLKIAKEKGLDFSNPVLVGYDMNHPLTPTWDSLLYPLITVQRGILAIHGARSHPAVISGWDLSSLRYFRNKRLGIRHMGLIGELGAVYEQDGKIFEIMPVKDEKYFELIQSIVINSAEAGLKIAMQGNISRRVACVYFEADEDGRGNLKNHFFTRDKETAIADIYASIRERRFFEFDGERLIFEPSLEAIMEIVDVLTRIHTLQSVRLSKEGNKICLHKGGTDNRNFSLDDMSAFVKKIIPKGWEFDPNNDFCVDLKYTGDGIKLDKELTANNFAKRKFGTSNYIITNTGDKKGDVLVGKNTIFFPTYGTQAEKYCEDNKIPHVSVINGADYSLIIAEIVNQRQKEVAPLLEVIKVENIE